MSKDIERKHRPTHPDGCGKSSWYARFLGNLRYGMNIRTDGEAYTARLGHAPQSLPFASEIDLGHARCIESVSMSKLLARTCIYTRLPAL